MLDFEYIFVYIKSFHCNQSLNHECLVDGPQSGNDILTFCRVAEAETGRDCTGLWQQWYVLWKQTPEACPLTVWRESSHPGIGEPHRDPSSDCLLPSKCQKNTKSNINLKNLIEIAKSGANGGIADGQEIKSSELVCGSNHQGTAKSHIDPASDCP